MPTIAGFSSAAVFAGIGAAAAVGSAVNSFVNKPEAPKAATPQPAPQSGQAPSAAGALSAIQQNGGAPSAGPGGGQASTFLTGSSGVDPSKLTLGRNAILGL